MKRAAKTRHLCRELEGAKLHYREAGAPSSTTVHFAGDVLDHTGVRS